MKNLNEKLKNEVIKKINDNELNFIVNFNGDTDTLKTFLENMSVKVELESPEAEEVLKRDAMDDYGFSYKYELEESFVYLRILENNKPKFTVAYQTYKTFNDPKDAEKAPLQLKTALAYNYYFLVYESGYVSEDLGDGDVDESVLTPVELLLRTLFINGFGENIEKEVLEQISISEMKKQKLMIEKYREVFNAMKVQHVMMAGSFSFKLFFEKNIDIIVPLHEIEKAYKKMNK